MPHFVTYSHVSRRAAVTHLQWSQAQGAYRMSYGPVPQVPIPFWNQVRTVFIGLLVKHLFTIDINVISAIFLKFSRSTIGRSYLAKPKEREAPHAGRSSLLTLRDMPPLDEVAEGMFLRSTLVCTALRFMPRTTEAIRFWRQSSFPPRPLSLRGLFFYFTVQSSTIFTCPDSPNGSPATRIT